MLSNTEQKQMRQLIQTPQWAAAEQLAQKLIEKIKEEALVETSEWELIRSALSREFKVRGIQQFVKEIYQQAQNADAK